MPVILNFSSERVLSESELEALRHVGRVSQSEQLVVRGRTMRLHHISFMDSFSVEPVSGGLLDRLSAREHRLLAENLEIQLNRGHTFLQAFRLYMEQSRATPCTRQNVSSAIQNKINSHAFTVSHQDFSCHEQHLNCPITLCIPETGVFVRNAKNSEICSLYDHNALTELIRRNAPHPLSREPFVPEMIVSKDECHFNLIEQYFCILATQNICTRI
ncbi:T3SS effector E3 ubiquitin-protein ligase NleG [Escherichia coli]|nr:T3SS effector E3 ubiquitin-protein ligase NleG [Escherichia coli]EFC6200850.1 T3SS effector E3 ubiquitin-protein ligase NleG [Escherichia coli]EFC8186301.1 T3SS effector E3 ubiquitin-protein ligase NleG [Escherichia coli]EHA5811160.1 T3SS effector E3 ubiquitin-protein ligase NleG [Escherichia coli]